MKSPRCVKVMKMKLTVDVFRTLPITGSILVKLAEMDLSIYDIDLSFDDCGKSKFKD